MQGSVALHTVALLCPQTLIQQACVQSQRSSPITSDLYSSEYREIEKERNRERERHWFQWGGGGSGQPVSSWRQLSSENIFTFFFYFLKLTLF